MPAQSLAARSAAYGDGPGARHPAPDISTPSRPADREQPTSDAAAKANHLRDQSPRGGAGSSFGVNGRQVGTFPHDAAATAAQHLNQLR